MNKTIIIRNLFLLKNQYLKYLSIILLVPMLFYMINVLFFSNFFNHEIKLWSSPGVWFSSCIVVSYIYIYDIFSIFRARNNNVNFIVTSTISIFNILLSAVVFSLIIALIELIISYFLIYILNGSSISFIHFIYILFSVFPVTLIFISIGIILWIQ